MQEGDSPKGPLEKIKKALYTPGAHIMSRARRPLHREHVEAGSEWQNEDIKPTLSITPPRASFARKLFICASIFFLLAAGISSFFMFGGGNLVSSKNVSILINGPVSIEAGATLSFQVIIENRNDVALESAALRIEYPDGTRNPVRLEETLSRYAKEVGNIAAHALVSETVQAAFLGQEGDEKQVRVFLEYRLKDSNAIFTAEKAHSIYIKSSPINIRVGTLREVNAGQEFQMTIEVDSNSQELLRDVLLSLDYPFGFELVESSPLPTFGTNAWRIGDLAPGSKRKFTLRGVLHGQDGEEKVFRMHVGAPSAEDRRVVGIAYAETVETIVIARPFLGMRVFFNGNEAEEYSVNSNQTVTVRMRWQNNLPTRILDGVIEVKLLGDVLNRASIEVDNGFYRSVDNTIVWDKGTLPGLSSIEPGETGEVTFKLSALSLFSHLISNPSIMLTVHTKGNRLSERGVPEEIRGSVSRTIKINSDFSFAQKGVHFVGPFTNTGPLPPRVEQETTYTIIWTVVNSANGIIDAHVEATLPPYARFVGTVSPQSEVVNYIAAARTLRWDLGRVKPGSGITGTPREVAFQIALLPSVSQIGQVVELVSAGVFTGQDEFTKSALRLESGNVTTNISADPQYQKGDGQIAQ